MRFTHLPGNRAPPLLVILACCVGVACAGAIPTTYNRHDTEPRSPPSATDTHENRDHTSSTSGNGVEAAKPQQKTVLVKGGRTREVPAELSDWLLDNGTIAQQRVVRAAGTPCSFDRMVRVVEHGVCISVGGTGIPSCSAGVYLDLNNGDCSTSR